MECYVALPGEIVSAFRWDGSSESFDRMKKWMGDRTALMSPAWSDRYAISHDDPCTINLRDRGGAVIDTMDPDHCLILHDGDFSVIKNKLIGPVDNHGTWRVKHRYDYYTGLDVIARTLSVAAYGKATNLLDIALALGVDVNDNDSCLALAAVVSERYPDAVEWRLTNFCPGCCTVNWRDAKNYAGVIEFVRRNASTQKHLKEWSSSENYHIEVRLVLFGTEFPGARYAEEIVREDDGILVKVEISGDDDGPICVDYYSNFKCDFAAYEAPDSYICLRNKDTLRKCDDDLWRPDPTCPIRE